MGAPTDGSAWEDEGDLHVLRGGSWYNTPGDLRSSGRNWDASGARFTNFGFRLVQEIN